MGLVDDNTLKPQKDLLAKISASIGSIQKGISEQLSLTDTAKKIEHEQEKAEFYCNKVKVKMEEIRLLVDELETIMDDSLWPIPKFWEMLFVC